MTLGRGMLVLAGFAAAASLAHATCPFQANMFAQMQQQQQLGFQQQMQQQMQMLNQQRMQQQRMMMMHQQMHAMQQRQNLQNQRTNFTRPLQRTTTTYHPQMTMQRTTTSARFRMYQPNLALDGRAGREHRAHTIPGIAPPPSIKPTPIFARAPRPTFAWCSSVRPRPSNTSPSAR